MATDIVINSATGTMGHIAAKRSRYEKAEVGYGKIKVNSSNPDILLGDTAVLSFPMKEIIEARFVSNAATPDVLELLAGTTALNTPTTWVVDKSVTAIDYFVTYIRGTGHVSTGNAGDGVQGVALAVTVNPYAPALTHGTANTLGTTTATITATVQPNGGVTTVTFDWGTTSACSTHTAVVPTTNGTVSGTSTVVATLNITGLTTNTQYYYKVHATNPGGTTTSTVNFSSDPVFHTV